MAKGLGIMNGIAKMMSAGKPIKPQASNAMLESNGTGVASGAKIGGKMKERTLTEDVPKKEKQWRGKTANG